MNTDHIDAYAEYSRRFLAVGGPDPHVRIIAEAARRAPDVNALWLAGCYISVYTIGGAAALLHHLPTVDAVLSDTDAVERLVGEHRRGFPMRRERRAVWNPRKLSESLVSYAHWADANRRRLRSMTYDELWESARESLRYFGRYATMKLLGTLRWMDLVSADQYDIRPHGAWSPRATLALMLPDHEELLKRDTSSRRDVLSQVNGLALLVKLQTEQRLNRELPWFQYETLLCNYRQALGPKGKPVGGSHDNELKYWRRAQGYWHGTNLTDTLPFFAIRDDVFPRRCLQEHADCRDRWDGPRKDLQGVYDRYGYWWSDLEYDYCATANLEEPVSWDNR